MSTFTYTTYILEESSSQIQGILIGLMTIQMTVTMSIFVSFFININSNILVQLQFYCNDT